MVSVAVARRCAKPLRFNFNNDPSLSQRFGFSALIRWLSPREGPARVSIRIAVIAGSPILNHRSLSPPCLSCSPSLPPTHAHPRCSTSACNLELHVPFLSLWLLSISHMHTCACTPRTRFPFELSWQLSPPSLAPPPPPLSLSSRRNSNEEHTLLSRQGWNLCRLRTGRYVTI